MARELGNFSNTTNATDGKSETDNFYVSYFTFTSITLVLGTICNLWLLCAIITSPDVRGRLRNKIISSLALVHLIQTLLEMPIELAITIQEYINQNYISCQGYKAYMNISLMVDFVANWILVSLLAVFIAQIYDYNPAETWTPLAVKRATAAIIVVPWLASFIIVIGTLQSQKNFQGCKEYLSRKVMTILRSVDTVIPISISIAMLIAAAFLRHRRFSKGSSSGMRTELIGQGPQIDSPVVYIVSVTVAILTEFMYFLGLYKAVSLNNIHEFITYLLLMVIIMEIRVILMTFPWLLLPDIRERIKTWRPWYRPPPGIDLSVAYGKEHS